MNIIVIILNKSLVPKIFHQNILGICNADQRFENTDLISAEITKNILNVYIEILKQETSEQNISFESNIGLISL